MPKFSPLGEEAEQRSQNQDQREDERDPTVGDEGDFRSRRDKADGFQHGSLPTPKSVLRWGRRRRSHNTTIRRVTMIAVNIEVTIPIARVTAKPLIGPEPKEYRKIAREQGRQVGVDNRRKRALITGVERRHGRAAEPHFLADTLEDQHIGVNRHANGQHDPRDTRQGQGRLKRRQRADEQGDVEEQRDIGEDPEQAVRDDHERRRPGAHDRRSLANLAGFDGVGAEARPDRALLQHRQAAPAGRPRGAASARSLAEPAEP